MKPNLAEKMLHSLSSFWFVFGADPNLDDCRSQIGSLLIWLGYVKIFFSQTTWTMCNANIIIYFSDILQRYILEHHKDDLVDILLCEDDEEHFSVTVK